MSVVNRMLQDIDRRTGAAAGDARSSHPDVRSVPPSASHRHRNAWIAGGVVLLAAVGAILATGWGEGRLWKSEPAAVAPPRVVTAPPALVSPLPKAAVAPAASPPEEPDAPPPSARGTIDSFKLSLYLSTPIPAPPSGKVAAKVPATPAPATSKSIAPVSAPVSAPPSASTIKSTTPSTTTTPANTPTTTRSVVALRQVAAGETVVSARQLWNDGSREGALSTLRDALAAAEASRDPQAVRMLARELAGLELASNRPQAALELLRRHAGLLGEDADALALRGNAQQRLGVHSEAAESYLAALRLRPSEGKWMLGAAISLAADGRREEAQAWVDQARNRGAITPPIAAYLQQLGFNTRQ